METYRFRMLSIISLSLILAAAAPAVANPTWESQVTQMTSPTSGNAAASITIAKPSGVVAGDLLLAQIVIEKGTSTTINPTLAEGWTQLYSTTRNDDFRQGIYYKIAGGSEPGSYVFGFSASMKGAGAILRYSGVDVSNPIVDSSENAGNSNSLSATGISTVANSTVVALFSIKKKDTSFPNPASMVDRYLYQNPQDVRIRASDQFFASAGGTGNKTSTTADSAAWVAHLVALRAKPGKIVIEKVVVPDTSEESFDFNLSGGPTSISQDFSLSHGQNTEYTIPPGTYTVSETPVDGWDVTISEPCEDSFLLASGTTVTCTFTNTQRGMIIIKKNTDPEDSEETFDITLSGDSLVGDISLTVGVGQDDDSGWIKPGTYSLEEAVPVGWKLASATCDNDSGTFNDSGIDDISVAPGEVVTCTFNNSQLARISVIKITEPADPDTVFNFTLSSLFPDEVVIDSFGLSDDGGSYDSDYLDAGTYSVVENLLEGWDLTNASCSDDKTPSSFVLSPGDLVVCTFTNTLQQSSDIIVTPYALQSHSDIEISGSKVKVDGDLRSNRNVNIGGSGGEVCGSIFATGRVSSKSTIKCGGSSNPGSSSLPVPAMSEFVPSSGSATLTLSGDRKINGYSCVTPCIIRVTGKLEIRGPISGKVWFLADKEAIINGSLYPLNDDSYVRIYSRQLVDIPVGPATIKGAFFAETMVKLGGGSQTLHGLFWGRQSVEWGGSKSILRGALLSNGIIKISGSENQLIYDAAAINLLP